MKMTRAIYLLLSFFCTIEIISNTLDGKNCVTKNHLDFLGIEIDGKSTDFQRKLESIGFIYNEYESNSLPKGQVKYAGCYNTHDVEATIFYNRKTAIVYKLELSAHFSLPEMAQLYLQSCINEIEKNYLYLPEHDIEDPTSMHYVYKIIRRDSSKIIGTIKINPTSSYLISGEGEIVGMNPTIEIVIEDSYNSSLLTPSTTEPSVHFGLIASDSCFFRKNYEWAMNYKKNHCYQECKFRLDWILNCYKYDYGVPKEFKDKEDEIEREIISIDSAFFCTIKTAYMGGSDVYRFAKTQATGLDFIIYGLGGWGKYIKLNTKQIEENIALFEKLKDLYNLRKNELSFGSFKSEKIELIPVTYGEEKYSEGFGSIHWKEVKLSVQFVSDKEKELKLEVALGHTPVLSFLSISDIAEYMNFLKKTL